MRRLFNNLKKMKPFWNKEYSSRISSKIDPLRNDNVTRFQNSSKDGMCSSFTVNKNLKREMKLEISQTCNKQSSLVSKKIRIYPNGKQVELFLKCFKAHRYIYNKGVEHFNRTNITNKNILQRAVVINDPLLSNKEKWLADVPKDTRVQAVRLLSKNIKTAFSNLRNGNISRFRINYLSKKRNNDIFSVNNLAVSYTEKQHKKKLRVFYHRLKKDSVLKISKKSRRWLENTEGIFNSKFNLNHFASITKHKDGSWYFIILYDKTPKETKGGVIDDLVALDPGVRTFQAFYSENSHGKIGDDFVKKRIKPINDRVDKLSSTISKVKKGPGKLARKKSCKKKYNMRKRCNKLRKRVSNTVLDIHRKAARFLTDRYNVILIPNFETQKMVSRSKRISKPTSRNMMQLSHYAFRQRLIELSNREKRCEVIVCTEEFTSKTCGQCGTLNLKLGSSKVFKCVNSGCNFTLDRDVNGARNIMIKYITELCVQKEDTPTEVIFE